MSRAAGGRGVACVLLVLCAAAHGAAAFLSAPSVRGRARGGAPAALAAKKAPKKGAAAAKPHIQVNDKFAGLKQLSKDPAIFTIDNFFDTATCERYLAVGPAGEESGRSLKVDSATFGGGFTAQNRQSTTWFLKYSSAPELIEKALQVLLCCGARCRRHVPHGAYARVATVCRRMLLRARSVCTRALSARARTGRDTRASALLHPAMGCTCA
jgi:hypothetical protein